jgi:hypothetical protein
MVIIEEGYSLVFYNKKLSLYFNNSLVFNIIKYIPLLIRLKNLNS